MELKMLTTQGDALFWRPVYVYMYVYVCVYIYIYVYLSLYLHIYIYIYVHNTHIHTHCVLCVYIYIHTCIYIYIYIHMHIYVYICYTTIGATQVCLLGRRGAGLFLVDGTCVAAPCPIVRCPHLRTFDMVSSRSKNLDSRVFDSSRLLI